MNRQEMTQYFDDPPPRQRKPRMQFGRAEAWRDYHGVHRRVDIWFGGAVVGTITGTPTTGNSCDYTIKINDKHVGPTLYTLAEAKRYARENC